MIRLLGTVGYSGDIPQINRPAFVNTDHHPADVVGVSQEMSGMDQNLAVQRGGETPGIGLLIGGAYEIDDLLIGQSVGSQTHRIQFDPDLAPVATDKSGN